MSDKGMIVLVKKKIVERCERCSHQEMFRLPGREATQSCILESTSSQEALGVGLGAFRGF
jgi:hypothetical protein